MKFPLLTLASFSEYSFNGDIYTVSDRFIWADLSVDPSDYYYVRYGGIDYPILTGHPGTAIVQYHVDDSKSYNNLSMGYPRESGQNPYNWSSNLKIDTIERSIGAEAVFSFKEEPRNGRLNHIGLLNPITDSAMGTITPPYDLYWTGDGEVTRISGHTVNDDGSLSIFFSSNVDPIASLIGVEVDRVDWYQRKVIIWPSATGDILIKGVFDSAGNPVPEFSHTFKKSAISLTEFALGDDKYQVQHRFRSSLEDYVNSRIAQWAQQNLR